MLFLSSISRQSPSIASDMSLHQSTLRHSWDVFLDFSPLIFFLNSRLPHQLSSTLYLLRPPPSPTLVSLSYFISDEGRVQQEVHLHLYHTCNVLSALTAGLSSVVSTCHFGNRTPVIRSPHPKAHFARRTRGRGTAFNATCPVYRLLAICISSPRSRKAQALSEKFFFGYHQKAEEGNSFFSCLFFCIYKILNYTFG